jgi:hypothetical protein
VTGAFNSPVEVAVRVLAVLVESYPRALDLGQLVMLDHLVLNTADVDGPESLHPPLPTRIGQLTTKRASIEGGIQVLLGADLAQAYATADGLTYLAGEPSLHFLNLLESAYANQLTDRANWVVDQFGDLSQDQLRAQFRTIFNSWVEEFDVDNSAREV